MFRRELADIGRSLDAVVALADHHRFLDTFFDNIFSDFSVQSRIGDALRTCGEVREQVDRQLARLDQHRNALLARRTAAEQSRRGWQATPE